MSTLSDRTQWQLSDVTFHSAVNVADKAADSQSAAKRYSEDQPRDSDGKFASGGSDKLDVEPAQAIADGKQGYLDANSDLGAPGKLDIDYSTIKADPVIGKAIADIYAAAPLDDPAAHTAYEQLGKENTAQFEYLTKTLGVTVDVTDKDPYPSVKEMAADLRENNHLSVLSTAVTGGHPFFTNEQNDQFRAVHDAFGHAATGRGFDRNGESAAWLAHMQMYSPLAGQALTTETRAQNSSMIYGSSNQPLIPAVNPNDTGGFPPQKIMLLPDQYTTVETRAAQDRQATPQEQSDQDNLYALGHSHHTSNGRHFPPTAQRHISRRYSEDQPRDPDGKFASGSSDKAAADALYAKAVQDAEAAIHQPSAPQNAALTPGSNVFGYPYINDMVQAKFDLFPDTSLPKAHLYMGQAMKASDVSPPAASEVAKGIAVSAVADEMFRANGTKFDGQLGTSRGVINAVAEFTPMTNADATPEYLASKQAEFLEIMKDPHNVVERDGLGVRISVDVNSNWHGVDRAPAPGDKPDPVLGGLAYTGKVLNASADTPEAMQLVREAAVSSMIHVWAGTSNDTSPQSLAMQEAAKAEFGLQGTAVWDLHPGLTDTQLDRDTDKELAANGDLYRAFLRAQYTVTQSTLKDAGITAVTLHRGQDSVTGTETQFTATHEPGDLRSMEITTRPMSSWSESKETAMSFAPTGGNGIVYHANVPAERILSTPVTGFGCLGEHEVVVLGGTDAANAESRYSPSAPTYADHGDTSDWPGGKPPGPPTLLPSKYATGLGYKGFASAPPLDEKRYSEDQPRDADGKFASGGSSSQYGSLRPPGRDSGSTAYGAPSSAMKVVGKNDLREMQSNVIMANTGMSKSHAQYADKEDVKAMVCTSIANAMVKADGSKWDSKLLTSYTSQTEIGSQLSDGRMRSDIPIADVLTKDTLVYPFSTGGAYVGTTDEVLNKVSRGDEVQAILDRNNGVVLQSDLGSLSRGPGRTASSEDEVAFARGDTPEALQILRESGVSGLIHTWAGTSNDTNAISLAIQDSAVKEFGLTNTSEWKIDESRLGDISAPAIQIAQVQDLVSNGEFYQAFLRAQYTETQSQLKSAGVTEVTLHRGQIGVTPAENAFADSHEKYDHDTMEITTRPMSSWSMDKDTADGFGIGYADNMDVKGPGIVYNATVPADRILSTATSGFGCYGEQEIVVLGGKDTVEAEKVRNTNAPVGVSNGP